MSLRKLTTAVKLEWEEHREWGFWQAKEQTGPIADRYGWLRLTVGRETNEFWITRARWEEIQAAVADETDTMRFGLDGSSIWSYKGSWFRDFDGLAAEDVRALVDAREIKQRQTIDRAKTLTNKKDAGTGFRREGIPTDLRLVVWQRDGGQCTECGSTSDLQFDHIIPVAMGGATSEQNLQILCGPCNRSKGASLG